MRIVHHFLHGVPDPGRCAALHRKCLYLLQSLPDGAAIRPASPARGAR